MKLIILNSEQELSEYAAKMVADHVNDHPNGLLVFPTGNTPLGMFESLVQSYKKNRISFKNSYLLELDEYFGIGLNDFRSLFAWLDRTLIQNVDFLPENVFRFNSDTYDSDTEIQRIEKIVQSKNGIDLLVLGLGPNGHIGFNEPGSLSTSPTRIVNLSQESLQSNSRYWNEDTIVPQSGFTLGMDILLNAKKVLLLVQDYAKAEILYSTLTAPISPSIPSTYLRTLKNLFILADKKAASRLNLD
jgi:glucosamine-6-phosphate deaminase